MSRLANISGTAYLFGKLKTEHFSVVASPGELRVYRRDAPDKRLLEIKSDGEHITVIVLDRDSVTVQ